MTRYGIEGSSLDLEQRLRGIESALDKKKDSNPRGNAFASWASGTPQVTGIEVNEAINAWRVTWEPVLITGLQKYEVQVSNDPTFRSSTSFYTRYNWFTRTDNTSTGTRYVRIRALSTSQGAGLWSAYIDTTTGLVTSADITTNTFQQFAEWTNADADSFDHIYDGDAGVVHALSDPTPAATTATYGPVTLTTSADGIVVPYSIMKVAYQCIYFSVTKFTYGLSDGPNLALYPSNELQIEVLRQEAGQPSAEVIDTMTFDWFNGIVPGTLNENYLVRDGGLAACESVRGYTTMDGQLNVSLLPDQPGAGTFSYSIRATVTSESTIHEEYPDIDVFTAKAFIYFRPYYVRLRFFEYKSIGEQ